MNESPLPPQTAAEAIEGFRSLFGLLTKDLLVNIQSGNYGPPTREDLENCGKLHSIHDSLLSLNDKPELSGLQGSVYFHEGFYRYINPQNYEHCDHKGKELIPVSTAFGNKSFVCESCGMVAKKELTSTSL